MDNIIEILIRRDGCTHEEAVERVEECKRRLKEEAIPTGDYECAVDIIEEELGLEPDYMMYLLL